MGFLEGDISAALELSHNDTRIASEILLTGTDVHAVLASQKEESELAMDIEK